MPAFVQLAVWTVATVFGAVLALRSPYRFATDDAVSYLDIADAYLHHHWSGTINGYWSPLYSWVLAIAAWIGRPSSSSEILLVRATNFLLYLAALAAFAFLLQRLIADHGDRISLGPSQIRFLRIPNWVWATLGYPLFFWASFEWIGLRSDTPDMFASALIYTGAGLAIRRRPDRSTLTRNAMFGAVLGFAYLAKAAMLPVALTFLLVDAIAAGRSRPLTHTGVSFVTFLTVAAPFAATLSVHRGHATIGDSGKLSYTWLVYPTRDFIPDEHWQGGPSGFGMPWHSTRLIRSDPPIFEFAGPVGGTYPPWTDPSYWYEGLTVRFDARAQWEALWSNVQFYYDTFLKYAIAFYAIVFCLGGTRASAAAVWNDNSILIAPALVGLAAYALVSNLAIANITTQPSTRLVAPFMVLVFGSMLSGLRIPESPAAKATLARVTIVVFVVLSGALGMAIADDLHRMSFEQPVAWRVACALRELGIRSGEAVAILGRKYDRTYDHEFWARLARVKIVSDVPDDRAVLRLSAERRRELRAALAGTGARAIIYKPRSARDLAGPWQPLSDGYYAYILSPMKDDEAW